MAIESNLVSQIPIPVQNWQTKSNIPSVATVKVNDIEENTPECAQNNTKKTDSFFEKIKAYFVEKRLKHLENIPAEKRTPLQQAEIEANQKSADYMV